MSDFEEEMEETTKRARALGVSGSESTDSPELKGEPDGSPAGKSAEAEPSSTSAALETSETSETDVTDETTRDPGGLDDHIYPNPDKDIGALIDTYENFNVYVPPEVKKEVNAFHKQLDYEFAQEFGEDLDKHWDFYTALFRAVLRNREIVREELGMSESE